MKNFILYFLLAVLAGEIIYLVIPKKPKEKVLAENTIVAPSPSPFSSPKPTAEAATPKPTPFSSPKPTAEAATPVPKQKYTSEEINGFIDRFAGQYAVDPNVLRHIAICESGFNASAYNAGYAGLFQFGTTTWKNLRVEIGEDPKPDLRYNAEEASQTAAYAFSIGDKTIWPNCQP